MIPMPSSSSRLAALLLPLLGACATHDGDAAPAPAPAQRSDLDAADLARVRSVTRPTTRFDAAEQFESLSGGAATVRQKLVNRDIYSQPSANLSLDGRQRFQIGNGLFRKDWVASPSSTLASDGLGPLFNARSCQGCHIKDGGGVVPDAGETAVSLFLRLSVPPANAADQAELARSLSVLPEPVYGGQLQTFAVTGQPAEADLRIEWEQITVAMQGGEQVQLRKPRYYIEEPAWGPLQPDVMISPRIAPRMIGLGLLEAIADADLLANADRRDDPDGVRGKARLVRDAHTGSVVLGRFGWKGGQPTVEQQSARAFLDDMGLSTPLHPRHAGECTTRQAACLALPHGAQAHLGAEEVPRELLDFVTFYSGNLAVPARRDVDAPQVLAGKRLFHEARCTACHVPKFVTRRDAAQPELAFQLIWPYTDLLLHDMGEGLADHRPEGNATGREWRTPPLWGIGLARTVNERSSFLHDGRARSVLEAILWHDGEGRAARDRVVAMTPAQRADLLRFIESL